MTDHDHGRMANDDAQNIKVAVRKISNSHFTIMTLRRSSSQLHGSQLQSAKKLAHVLNGRVGQAAGRCCTQVGDRAERARSRDAVVMSEGKSPRRVVLMYEPPSIASRN